MNIGDYVRFDYHRVTVPILIEKIVYIEYDKAEKHCFYVTDGGLVIGNENIIKSSPNILDLIEYDDILKIVYEGKEYICKVVNVSGVKGIQLTSTLSVGLGIVEAGIKSIVTHEMFESIEYKIGE